MKENGYQVGCRDVGGGGGGDVVSGWQFFQWRNIMYIVCRSFFVLRNLLTTLSPEEHYHFQLRRGPSERLAEQALC